MDLKLGKFEEFVLLALRESTGGESYGRKIRESLKEKTNRSYSIGAIYTTLNRLEEKGYVSSRLGEATAVRGGKAKRLFKLEGVGRKALIEKHNQVKQFWSNAEWGKA